MMKLARRLRRKYLETNFNLDKDTLLRELNRGLDPYFVGEEVRLSDIKTSYTNARKCAERLAKLSKKIDYPEHIVELFKNIAEEQRTEQSMLFSRRFSLKMRLPIKRIRNL